MSDAHEAKRATPHATLLAELLDSRIPKSEREHAAAREVERLTAECADLRRAVRHEADCVEAAKAEIERLTAALQYEQHRADPQITHADGCYAWGPAHYECAMAEIERLRADLERERTSDAESVAMYRRSREDRERLRAAVEALNEFIRKKRDLLIAYCEEDGGYDVEDEIALAEYDAALRLAAEAMGEGK